MFSQILGDQTLQKLMEFRPSQGSNRKRNGVEPMFRGLQCQWEGTSNQATCWKAPGIEERKYTDKNNKNNRMMMMMMMMMMTKNDVMMMMMMMMTMMMMMMMTKNDGDDEE